MKPEFCKKPSWMLWMCRSNNPKVRERSLKLKATMEAEHAADCRRLRESPAYQSIHH